MNGNHGALLLVPQWQCISSFVFYFFMNVFPCSLICKIFLLNSGQEFFPGLLFILGAGELSLVFNQSPGQEKNSSLLTLLTTCSWWRIITCLFSVSCSGEEFFPGLLSLLHVCGGKLSLVSLSSVSCSGEDFFPCLISLLNVGGGELSLVLFSSVSCSCC